MTGLLLLTLRELRAKKVILGLFLVSTLIWVLLAFALQLDVVDGSLASVRLFGMSESVEVEAIVRDSTGAPVVDPETGEAVREMRSVMGENPLEQLVFAAEAFVAGVAYWVGILLALFATAGLVTSLLERGQVDLLLSKPLRRSQILGGRLLGVTLMMGALLVYLLGAVWLVMSLKTGVWNGRFLLAIGVVLAMFLVMYSVITLVSVSTGSTALALITTLGLIFATLILSIPDLAIQVVPPWRQLIEGLYHVLPEFPSVGTKLVPQLATGEPVESLYPLGSSLLFGAALYAASFWIFSRKDF